MIGVSFSYCGQFTIFTSMSWTPNSTIKNFEGKEASISDGGALEQWDFQCHNVCDMGK